MTTLNGMYRLTVEEEQPNHGDDFAGWIDVAKEFLTDSPATPSRTHSLQTSQDLETELNTFRFCIGLPFSHPPPNISQSCCLCEKEYYPEWCLRGPETSVMLPCGCLLGHLCALHWFSKCELGNQNCPNCNTLVVDGYGNAVRVDKPGGCTDDEETFELSTTGDQPDASEAVDLVVPANQQDHREALPWNEEVTSNEVDDAAHRRPGHTSRRQGTGIINEENEFAWLSLPDPAEHRLRDQDDDEHTRGRSRQSPADVAAASDGVAPPSNKQPVWHQSSEKAGPTKATRGLAKAASVVNMMMRPY